MEEGRGYGGLKGVTVNFILLPFNPPLVYSPHSSSVSLLPVSVCEGGGQTSPKIIGDWAVEPSD